MRISKAVWSVIIVCVLLALVFFAIVYFNARKPTGSISIVSSTIPTQKSPVVISTDAQGNALYTNRQFKFSLTYPSSWRVGDNNLGVGTFQLFNYDFSGAIGGDFKQGQNKIELAITDIQPANGSEGNVSNLVVAGQPSRRIVVDNGDGRYVSYQISLPSSVGKVLSITIYGDPSNFRELDSIVETIHWSQS